MYIYIYIYIHRERERERERERIGAYMYRTMYKGCDSLHAESSPFSPITLQDNHMRLATKMRMITTTL